MNLSQSAQKWLFSRARSAIERFLETKKQDECIPEIPLAIASEISVLAGTFVTLHGHNGQGGRGVRGMMGEIYATGPLWQVVPQYAVGAAFFDMHVPRLKSYELNEVRIQIGLVSDITTHETKSMETLLDYLEVNHPGVIIEINGRQGFFLPSVWERLSEPLQFLRMLEFQLGLYRVKARKNIQYKTFDLLTFEEKVEFIRPLKKSSDNTH